MRLVRPILITLAGLALVASLALALRSAALASSADGRYGRLGAALDTLDGDLAELRSRRRGDRLALDRLARALDNLSAHRSDAVSAAPAPVEAGEPEAPAAEDEATDELAELRRRVVAGEATEAEMERFWLLARGTDELEAVIGRMEAAVAGHPEDVDARLRLARAFVTKLYSVPDGPTRGAWAGKAEKQWRAVLARNSGNWEARFSLATSLSQWPAFFGKGAEAVTHIETLIEQQESRAPQSHEPAAYHLLADLHRKHGRPDDALSVLEAGARRHPHDERLREAADAARR